MWRQGRGRARARARAIDSRLDPSAYLLLMTLVRREPLPMSQLVAALDLDKSTVTRQVDAVVRLGLAERHTDPRDARARMVSLTPLGRERCGAVVESAAGEWRARLAQWDPDDVRTLTGLLRRLEYRADESAGDTTDQS